MISTYCKMLSKQTVQSFVKNGVRMHNEKQNLPEIQHVCLHVRIFMDKNLR